MSLIKNRIKFKLGGRPDSQRRKIRSRASGKLRDHYTEKLQKEGVGQNPKCRRNGGGLPDAPRAALGNGRAARVSFILLALVSEVWGESNFNKS